MQTILVFQTDLGWYVRLKDLVGPYQTREDAMEKAEALLFGLHISGENGAIVVARETT